jgi:transglutaminase-like putative cysteine protease
MWHKQPIAAIAIAVIVLLAGSVLAGDEMKFGKISDADWQVGAPDNYPEANAVVIMRQGQLTIKDDVIITEYLVRIKILTEAGAEEVGDRYVEWHRESARLKKFKAHTITPDGKKHKVEKNAIFEKEYGDYKRKTFTFPLLEPGCIVEYRYRVFSDSFWRLRPWYFQSDIYTLKSTFSTTIPNGYIYNVSYYNIPPYLTEPIVTERPDMDSHLTYRNTLKTFKWELVHLPPIKDEPYMASKNDYRSSLRFTIVSYTYRGMERKYLKSWVELGEIMQKHFDDYEDKKKDTRKLAEQATAGLTDPRAKSRALYDYVTAEFATVEDIDGRWLAHDHSSGMLKEKKGNGEEKNLLLIKMHQAIGLEAWSVMISTRDHAKFDSKFPDLRQFNYIIAYVQFSDGYKFLDCAGRLSPYGLLPPRCITTGGLLVDGSESQVIRIKQKGLYSGRTDRTRMYINEFGQASCSTQCSFRGYYASLYGRRYEDKQPDEFVEEYFLDRLDIEYALGDYDCRLDSADSFVMTADYTPEGLVTPLDNNLLINPVSYAFRSNPFESERRFFPVDFSYPFTYKNVVELFVTSDVEQYLLPDDVTHQIDGATFTRKSTVTDSSVIMISTLLIEQPEFKPPVYSDVRELFAKVALATEDEVTAILTTE